MRQLLRLNWGRRAAIALALLAFYPAGVAASGSDAVPVVPHSDVAAIFDVLSSEHDFQLDRPTLTFIDHVLEQEHYRVRWYGKGGNAGPATLRNFVKLADVGVLVIDTHGSFSSLLVQNYRTHAAATNGQDNYVRQYGAKGRDWMFVDKRDLLLTSEGISHFFGDRAGKHIDLVFNIACEGWHLSADFDAVAYFGYSTDVVCKTALLDAEPLFSRLSGDSGVENRTTVGAYGLGGFVHEGFRQQLRLSDPGHPVVLSPAVESVSPGSALVASGATVAGEVQFDAAMDTKNTEGVVTATGCGGASVTNERWASDDPKLLQFDLNVPSNASGGTITLRVHNTAAIAAPGGSPNELLDGNTGPIGESGVAPNGNDYVWQVPCQSGGFHLSGNVTTTLALDSTTTCNNGFTSPNAFELFMTPTGQPYTPPQEDSSLNITLSQNGTTTFPTPDGAVDFTYNPNGSVPDAYNWGDFEPLEPGIEGTVTIQGDGSSGSVNLTLPALTQLGKQGQASSPETIVGSWNCSSP